MGKQVGQVSSFSNYLPQQGWDAIALEAYGRCPKDTHAEGWTVSEGVQSDLLRKCKKAAGLVFASSGIAISFVFMYTYL